MTAPYLGSDLDIVVVHYRTPDLLRECLVRLRASAPAANVMVVDTAPDAAVLEALAREFPAVRVTTTENHSYSHSVNVGARATDGQLFALMNADVLVEEASFADLVTALVRDPTTAAVGPVALDGRGRRQDLGLAYRLNYARAARAWRTGDTTGVVVPWLSGCLQLIRRSAFEEVGGYDRSLRFANEDLDFCLKLRQRGHFLRLVDSRVTHVGGTSTPNHPAFLAEGRRGGYIISRRYQSRVVQTLHRAYLEIETWFGQRCAPTPEARRASEMVAAMLRDDSWDDSPFGATLDDR